MKTRTLYVLALCRLLWAAGSFFWPAIGAAESAGPGEGNCSADRALALVRAADEAGNAQNWGEARIAYAQAEDALRELVVRCPGRLADRAETLLASLPASKAAVEAGLERTVCQPASLRARELDEQAAQQSEKKDWTAVVRLFGEAETAWREAAAACLGDNHHAAVLAQEKAARGRARAANQLERPACRTSFAEATRLKASARAAWETGQWQEAAGRYREAERAWGSAASACTGSRRVHADKERSIALGAAEETDRCAPFWSRALDLSGRYKILPASVSEDARRALHHRLEIYWGQAADACRGRAAEIARTQAEGLARERGGVPLPPLASLPEPKGVVVASVAAPDASEVNIRVGDTIYAGRFRRDPSNLTLSGQGRVVWDNGNVFTGTLVLGKAEGQGRMVWRNGDRYEGQWKYDLPQGQGSMVFGDGSRYEGEFAVGRPEGLGRYTYGQGVERYEGEFREGQPEGWGTYFWKTGDRFEGVWKEGRKNGPGRLIWAGGESAEGWYENDRPVPAPAGQ